MSLLRLRTFQVFHFLAVSAGPRMYLVVAESTCLDEKVPVPALNGLR